MLVVLAMLAAGLVIAPGGVRAALFSPDTAAGYGLQDELAELGRVRERIVHRRALRHALAREVGALALEIDTLRERRGRSLARLRADRHALRAQERALDRIVPRLVARERTLHERRRQAAGALADLASLSRRGELDPTIRARMRAISPVLVELLRAADPATVALERRHDRAARAQRRLESEAPLLDALAQQLRRQRERKADRRRIARDRVAQLDAQLRELSAADARLGRRLVAVQAAHAMRAAPQADQPAAYRAASDRGGLVPWLRIASVRGRAPATPRLAQGVRARQTGAARVVAASPEPSLAPAAPLTAWVPADFGKAPMIGGPARMVASRGSLAPVAGLPAAGPEIAGLQVARLETAGLAIAGLEALPVAGLTSRVPIGHLPRLEPIRPSLDAVANRFHDGADGTDGVGIAIAAMPGQRVAAPASGRVVFADAFKSYGLLLIIEHDNEYHTLLWGFSRLQVGFGDEVRGGQIIGVMDVVDGSLPQLHVELRRNGRPVNPLPWLAGSSSRVRG